MSSLCSWVLEGVRIIHHLRLHLDERRLRAILIRPFVRRRPIVCPRRPRSAKIKSQCHHPRQNTSPPLPSPYAFRRQTDSITVIRAGMGPFPGGLSAPYPFGIGEASAPTAESRSRCPSPTENPSPFRSFRLPARTLHCHLWACDETFRPSASLPPTLSAASPHRICPCALHYPRPGSLSKSP